MPLFGFAKEDITPWRGVALCGYFEPRYNKGFHDRLAIKAALFDDGCAISGIVSYDLCLLPRCLVERFITALKNAGFNFAERLVFAATHTHTGPYTSPLFGNFTDEEYLNMVVFKTVDAVRNACKDMAEAEILTGRSSCSTLAFNRRFWMKDGSVLTNPGKLNPDIVKPEGVIDPEIPLMAVRQDGMLRLLVANISNHCDTIGDDMVSADWPGRMEAEIQKELGYDLPVIMFLGCQGNINHFNVENDVDQTNYAEACRIGKGYAHEILSQLYALKPVEVDAITVDTIEFEAPTVQISDEEYAAAKKILEEVAAVKAQSADDLTSEGIAKGNAYVKRFFAQRAVDCREKPFQGKRFERMIALKFGNELGIVSIPAEPFIEIQFAIKQASRFKLTMVGALAQGSIGYIALPESYGRGGGYETRPAPDSPARDLAPKVTKLATELLNK